MGTTVIGKQFFKKGKKPSLKPVNIQEKKILKLVYVMNTSFNVLLSSPVSYANFDVPNSWSLN